MNNIIDEIKDLKRRLEELEKRNIPNFSIPDPLSVSKIKTDIIEEKTRGAKVNVNNTLYIKNNGLVGIKNSNPQYELDVNGIIKAKNSEPLRAQKIHRRVVFGWGAHGYVDYNTNWTNVIYLYHPFGYAAPNPQSGAIRKIRLYAVYSDTVTDTNGGSQVLVDGDWGTDVYFDLPFTWGVVGSNRDSYSNFYTVSSWPMDTGHGTIKIRTTQPGSIGRLYYMEIEHWDFFY